MKANAMRLILILALLAAIATESACQTAQTKAPSPATTATAATTPATAPAAATPTPTPTPVPVVKTEKTQKFETEVKYTSEVKLNYLLYLPENYESSDKKWPLVLFMHGAGERGDRDEDVTKLLAHGLPQMIEQEGKTFPFIVVSPQCPLRDSWGSDKMVAATSALIDDISSHYKVDKDRIYLTGLSMGGNGTWRLATEFPHRFAAIIPMSGWGEPKKAELIAHLPIWNFHGAKDTTVKIEGSQLMVDALKAAGSDVKFTIFPDAGHDCWGEAYHTPGLYDWMLKQKRSDK